MQNHYHLIIETPHANLRKIMHCLDASYAAYFNTRYRRVGPLYQGRYKSVVVDQDEYLDELSRYIHLNPVRARIVKDPIDYAWSSYRYFVTDTALPAWLCADTTLSLFSRDPIHARRLYKRYVLDGIEKSCEAISKNTHNGIALGGEAFLMFIKERASIHAENAQELPQARAIQDEISLCQVEGAISRMSIADKRLRRRLMIYQMRRHTPRSLKEIASYCGNIGYTAISQACKRIEEKREGDKSLDALINMLDLSIKSEM
jgi:putative transposase